jgi:hypothetical protein
LQAFPQKQKKIFEAYEALYHLKPPWKELPEEDVQKLREKVAEAERKLEDKMKELNSKFPAA